MGDWFVAHLPDNQADDWDAYWLFGPTATWANQPPPLLSSGSSVIGERAGRPWQESRSLAQGIVSAASRASRDAGGKWACLFHI